MFSGNPSAEFPNKRFASRTGNMSAAAEQRTSSVYQSFLTPEQVPVTGTGQHPSRFRSEFQFRANPEDLLNATRFFRYS